jgi:hypothetical protein
MKYIYTIIFSFISLLLYSQDSKSVLPLHIPNNIERYKLDFEIKNAVSLDTSLVLTLNIDQYEHLRQETINVEVFDSASNVTLVIYSILTSQQNKRELNLYQRK